MIVILFCRCVNKKIADEREYKKIVNASVLCCLYFVK